MNRQSESVEPETAVDRPRPVELSEADLLALADGATRPVRRDLSQTFMAELGDDERVEEVHLARASEVLLRDALLARASDVHLDPHSDAVSVRFRIDGALHDVAVLSPGQGRRLINQLKTMADLDPVTSFSIEETRRSIEIDGQDVDLRMAAAPSVNGEKLAIRLLDQRRIKIDIHELGLSDEKLRNIEQWLGDTDGMFLVTGPTGSGKTTTLHALLRRLLPRQRSIITIEDPVEYRVDGAVQIQTDEEHGLTFAQGVKAMLRLDPDYMLVGEIRDAESANAAIECAGSGRVVLSTLHARDAVGAITGLRNWRLRDHEICSALAVVVAQRLVRTLCRHCRDQGEIHDGERRWLHRCGGPAGDRLDSAWRAVGCDHCGNLGYRGRTGVFEVWRLDEDDYRRILAGADERTLRRGLGEKGHGFLLDDALEKVRLGVTTVEELRGAGGFGALPHGSEDGDRPRVFPGT